MTTATPTMTRSDERTWAALAHLSPFLGWCTGLGFWIAPLVIWLVYKDSSRYVAEEAKQALNFQINTLIWVVIATVLLFVGIGIVLFPIIGVLHVALPIVAAIKASEGSGYRYPLTIRFL